jgi:hypothetical protein
MLLKFPQLTAQSLVLCRPAVGYQTAADRLCHVLGEAGTLLGYVKVLGRQVLCLVMLMCLAKQIHC